MADRPSLADRLSLWAGVVGIPISLVILVSLLARDCDKRAADVEATISSEEN